MQVILKNVLKVKDDEFLTEMNGKELLHMWKSKEITYFSEIQRGTVIKHGKNDEFQEVPVYSASNVKKIYNAMASGGFFTDMITLNILNDGDNDLEYDNGILTVNADCFAVSDGHHRLKALEMLEKSNQSGKTNIDLDSMKFAVKITHLGIKEAQQQFYQFAQGLKISSSRAEYFNQKDLPNLLVKRLMDKDMALDGLVEVVKNSIHKKDTIHLVSFATLVNA